MIRIRSPEEYADLVSNTIFSFSEYLETTILLETDIDFEGEVCSPLGSSSSPFNGVFDGQGHTIKNIKINATENYIGLIGYSQGAIIRNVIVNNDLSTTSNEMASGNIYMGGILGYLEPINECKIENCMNLGSISHTNGNENTSIYIGGIVGYSGNITSESLIVKNCANYGGITFDKGNIAGIGGIVGYSNNANLNINNCLNAGGIGVSGSSTPSFNQINIGGIVGSSRGGTLRACVNLGSLHDLSSQDGITRGVCGYTGFTFLENCFSLESPLYSMAGDMSYVFDSYNFTESLVLEGTDISLIAKLNEIADSYQSNFYSHWLSNPNSKEITFNIYDEKSFSTNSKIVLIPEFFDENQKWFNGWYADNAYTNPFTLSEVTGDTTLYGEIKEYPVYFYVRGVLVGSGAWKYIGKITLLGDEVVPRKDECEFKFWADKDGKVCNEGDLYTVLSDNVTLHAVFQCRKIETAEDFVDFALFFNADGRYSKDISLENDIDFDGCDRAFAPIGTDDNPFIGNFDGNGYVIKNLNINVTGKYGGILGLYFGTGIKNVVLDDSCSITVNDYHDCNEQEIGGIVGHVAKRSDETRIENCINMAKIEYNGGKSAFIGGIVGRSVKPGFSESPLKIVNCANYGTLTYSGPSSSYVVVGGIISETQGDNVINCLNAGDVNITNSPINLYVGGIIGISTTDNQNIFTNCVNSGNITASTENGYVGGIIGSVSNAEVSYCFWSDIDDYDLAGNGSEVFDDNVSSFNYEAFILNNGSHTGKIVTSVLNEIVSANSNYSHWFSNMNGKNFSIKINGRSTPILKTTSKIILEPKTPDNDPKYVNKWYTDLDYATLIDSYNITEDMELYWYGGNYTVNFYVRNSYVKSIDGSCGSAIELIDGKNDTKRDDCEFKHWADKDGNVFNPGDRYTIPLHDVTLHAVFFCEKIKTAEDLIDFALLVNAGELNYLGKTVSLENEIDFYGCDRDFIPIGKNESHCFNGSFDGKGYVIKNFEVNLTRQYVGLFGVYCGPSIKNVVLDESCIITVFDCLSHSIGGIVGSWSGLSSGSNKRRNHNDNINKCDMSGCISSASIKIPGNSDTGRINVGGLIGETNSVDLEMIDCGSYGTISVTGKTYSRIGGIIGYGSGNSDVTMNNTVFNGNIFDYSGNNGNPVGGFVGKKDGNVVSFTNCFNGGSADSNISNPYPFVGEDDSIPESCFVTSCSSGFMRDQSQITEINITTLRTLNAKRENNLTLLHFDSCSTFAPDLKKLPTLKIETHRFGVWCIDSDCSEIYDFSMGYREELWGKPDSYKVTFIYKNCARKAIAVNENSPLNHPFYNDDYSTKESWYYEDGTEYKGESVTRDLVLRMENKVSISTSADFIAFSGCVANYSGYQGMTIYIENDINMIAYADFKPIQDFAGTLDGKGNAIKNLKIDSSDDSVGLFGSLSDGAVIKNLVLDSSCSIEYDSTSRRRSGPSNPRDAYVGGIVGSYHKKRSGNIKISNVINEAKITAKGSDNIRVGGLVGSCDGCTIEDSSNKGEVTGPDAKNVTENGGDVGGIVGESENSSISGVVNYGKVTGSGRVGGIAGRMKGGSLSRAVNTGDLSGSNDTKGIVGDLTGRNISGSFWKNSTNEGFGGENVSGDCMSFGEDFKTSNGGNITELLNKTGEKWIKNPDTHTVTFYIDGEEYLKMNEMLFKLPLVGTEGFEGWFEDSDFKTNFTANFTSNTIDGDKELYGRWGNYTDPKYIVEIHFDSKKIGGSDDEVETKIIEFIDNKDTFRIVKFEDGNESGINDLLYIVKFVDISEREVINFIENVQSDPDLSEKIVDLNAYDAKTGDSILVKKSDNTGAIIGIVVGTCVVVIAIVAGFAVFMFKYQEYRNKMWVERLSRSRIVTNFSSELIHEDSPSSGVFKKPHAVYPKDYRPPSSLKEALTNSGMDDALADEVVEACDLNISLNNPSQEYSNGFNRDDAMAVSMYTFDFGNANYDLNPYRMLNGALASQDVEEVKKVRDMLYVVMTSLRRMPVVRGVTLYRGIRSSIDMSVHKVGAVISWPAFSSTTPNMKTTKSFLTKQVREKGNDVELDDGEQLVDGDMQLNGTMFVIEDAWGYDIQPYSFYQDEEEVLLEPGQQFRVESVVDGDKFTLITLKMVKTPQILPDRFGRIQE